MPVHDPRVANLSSHQPVLEPNLTKMIIISGAVPQTWLTGPIERIRSNVDDGVANIAPSQFKATHNGSETSYPFQCSPVRGLGTPFASDP